MSSGRERIESDALFIPIGKFGTIQFDVAPISSYFTISYLPRVFRVSFDAENENLENHVKWMNKLSCTIEQLM